MTRKLILTLLILITSTNCFSQEKETPINLNFDNVDIRTYIRYISGITNRNFVIDSNVVGNISVISPKPLTVLESYQVFESVLNLNGFTTVQAGKITKILPSDKAKGENLQVETDTEKSFPLDRVITQLVKLQYTTPEEMQTSLQPLIPKTSVITVHKQSNILLITDTKSNIQKLLGIISTLDTSNTKFNVITLQHAKAEDIVSVLEQFNTDELVKIKSDSKTNSIIVKASNYDYQNIKSVISSLDIPRKMVYLEALILEVNTQEDFQLGVKWFLAGNKNSGTVGTSWGGGSGLSLNPNVTSETDDYQRGSGFNLAYLTQGITLNGITFPNIAALLNAHKTDENYNIIATPQILTTDNTEARISIGSNVPYLTRAEESNSGNGYSNYEYKDIATTLSILPQINHSKTILLNINTEVSKINTSASTEGKPTTYKRTAQTTVIVKNNETIVIGGIIGEDTSQTEWKIPLLGDIPYLGTLFKTSGSKKEKTNMFIFITPHIISNPSEIENITFDKQQQISETAPNLEQHFQENKPKTLDHIETAFNNVQQNNHNEALKHYEKAINTNQMNAYIFNNLSDIMQRIGKQQNSDGIYLN